MTSETRSSVAAPHPEDWRGRKLADLIRHIVAKHHEHLREELPAMERMLSLKHSASQPQTGELLKTFRQFSHGMINHMKKEEAVLFPMIEKIESARNAGEEPPQLPFGTIEHPIAVMEEEHEQARKELAEIRALTNGFTQGESSALKRLKILDADMGIHSGLEDEILFPRAIALERGLGQ